MLFCILLNDLRAKLVIVLSCLTAEAPVSIEAVTPQHAGVTESASRVSVEVTTPDGKPGVVREDDKAPTFIQSLQTAEVCTCKCLHQHVQVQMVQEYP